MNEVKSHQGSSEQQIEEGTWSDNCECMHPSAVMAARRAMADAPPDQLAAIFAVLGDPTRMRVLVALGSSELCVTDLAAATGGNRTTISHQLRVLREHRLVRRRRDGKVVYYALDDEHVEALVALTAQHVSESAETAQDLSA
jgi:DNA-binding transcriptional ArsR family regulator